MKKIAVLGFAVMAVASVAFAASDTTPAPQAQNGQYYCPGPQQGCGYYAQNGNNGYHCGYYNNGQAQK